MSANFGLLTWKNRILFSDIGIQKKANNRPIQKVTF